jgi:hypothetical protein
MDRTSGLADLRHELDAWFAQNHIEPSCPHELRDEEWLACVQHEFLQEFLRRWERASREPIQRTTPVLDVAS